MSIREADSLSRTSWASTHRGRAGPRPSAVALASQTDTVGAIAGSAAATSRHRLLPPEAPTHMWGYTGAVSSLLSQEAEAPGELAAELPERSRRLGPLRPVSLGPRGGRWWPGDTGITPPQAADLDRWQYQETPGGRVATPRGGSTSTPMSYRRFGDTWVSVTDEPNPLNRIMIARGGRA